MQKDLYMSMVYCRGCGKEIHETAQSCPHCGATQGLKVEKNIFVLIIVALGWTLLLWIIMLFISGMIIGAMDPNNAEMAGEEFGEAAAMPFLFISLVASTLLTYFGKLPGSYRAK